MSPNAMDAIIAARKAAAAKKEQQTAERANRTSIQQQEQVQRQQGYQTGPSRWNRFKVGFKKMNIGVAAAGGAIGGAIARDAGKIKGRAAGVFFFLLIALTIHIFDYRFSAFPQYSRFFLYLILGIFGFLLYKDTGGRVLVTCVGITLVNWFIPQIVHRLPRNIYTTLSIVVLFGPAWGIYIYMKSRQEVAFVNLIGTLYLLVCVILITNYFIGEHPEVLGGRAYSIDATGASRTFGKGFMDWWGTFWKEIVETVTTAPEKIQQWYNQSMNYATGGYYAGQEEQVVEPLGVFLEDVESTAEEYFVGDSITIWATLKAMNVGKDPIKTKITCEVENWYDGEEYPEIKLEPATRFEMEGYDEVDLDCSIRDGLKKGYYDITINATFEFETSARLLTYWIDKERYRAVTRQGKDIFDEYDIPEEEPIAYYTSGPVEIGMGIGQPPIKVGDEVLRPRLGITVSSNWFEGHIAKITALEMLVPEEMGLDVESCSEEVEYSRTEEGFKVYSIVNVDKLDDIEDYHSVLCRFNHIGKEILDPTPITLKYVKARVRYIYVIDETIEIDVMCPPEGCVEDLIGKEGSIEEGEEIPDECSGSVGGYTYRCKDFKWCETAGGTIINEKRCTSGEMCCRTLGETTEEEEDTDCGSQGCCVGDLRGTCKDPCNENTCSGGVCEKYFCGGGSTRVCCIT